MASAFPEVTDVPVQQASIDTTPVPVIPQIDLKGPAMVAADPSVAATFAKKAEIGTKRPYQEIYDQMISGLEPEYRKRIASGMDVEKQASAQQDLVKTLSVYPQQASQEKFQSYLEAVKPTDPTTVFETTTGKEIVRQLDKTSLENDTFWPKSYEELPVEVTNWKAIGGNAAAWRDFALRVAADLEAEKQQAGFGRKATDFIKNIMPIYEEYNLRANVPNSSFFGNLVTGKGTLLDESRLTLTRQPLEQGKQEFLDAVEHLKTGMIGGNIDLAQKYALSVAGTATSDRQLDDMMTLVGVATSATAMKGVQIGARLLKGAAKEDLSAITRQAIKDQVRSSDLHPPSEASIVAGSGDMEKAATAKATEKIIDRFVGKPDTIEDVIDPMTSNFRFMERSAAEGSGRGNQNLVNMLVQGTRNLREKLVDRLATVVKVDRLPELKQLTQQELEIVKTDVKNATPGFHVADVSDPYFHTPFVNAPSVDLKVVNNDGNLFRSRGAAEAFAETRGLKIPENNIEAAQNGLGWYLRVRKPLDTSSSSVWKDFFVKTKDPEGTGWARAFLSWLVTPEETLSEANRANRKAVTHGPTVLHEVVAPQIKALKSLRRGATEIDPETGKAVGRQFLGNKKRWNDFISVLNAARKEPDAAGKPGKFFETTEELQNYYMNHVHRWADTAEVQAYWAFKNIVEMDRVLRDLRVVTNKWSRGAQSHQVSWFKDGQLVDGPKFDGIVKKQMPTGDAQTLVLGANGETYVIPTGTLAGGKLSKWSRKARQIDKEIEAGTKQIVQLYNNEERPFNSLLGRDEKIQYVVVDSGRMQTTDILYNQLPRRGGGHWDLEHEFYIKQPKIIREKVGEAWRHWYEGDTTIMPISIRKLGQEVVEHLNAIREHLKADDIASARQYLEDHPILGLNFKEVHSWFRPSKHPETGEILPPRLSKEDKIEVVPNNTLLVDHNADLKKAYSNFHDGTKEGNPARQAQVAYTGERDSYDLYSVNNWGTKHNPLYSYEPTAFVDPIETMNRGINRIINSTFLDDYKDFAVNRWISQASKYLRADPRELAAVPHYFFHNPAWLDPRNNALEISRLKATNWQVRQLLGLRSSLTNGIENAVQTFVDKIYEKSPRLGQMIPSDKLAAAINDPTKWMRSLAYHTNLGFYAIYQTVVQMQTYALIGALAPRAVAAGTSAAMMHQWLRINPGAIDHLDGALAKLQIPGLKNWKRGEFKEAFEELRNVGFGNIQADQLQLSGASMSQKLYAPLGKDILDGMTFFFKEGERSVRYGAWYTAFKEFRHDNPFARITNTERLKILNRADDLYANMSKASSSMLQHGVLATTTQFLSYQARMAELFLGTRTSLLDKARIVGVMSMLYGVPMGSVGVMGLPLSDYFRKTAKDNGYEVGENFAKTLFMEGIPSIVTAWLTSPDGDIKKGQFYNFGGRYGYQGLMQDVLRPDETWMKFIMGAGGSKVKDIISDLDPFMKSMIHNDQVFPRTLSDYTDIAKEINSVKTVFNAISGIQLGVAMSKKDLVLTDNITVPQALFMAGTGLQKQEVPDAYLRNWSEKDWKEYRENAAKMFQQNFHRAIINKDNPTEAKRHMTKAFGYLDMAGVPREDYGKAISRAVSGKETLVKNIEWNAFNSGLISAEQYVSGERIRQNRQ
jgi:hypothetical protein